ncbi:hypothetical protein L484_020189 [Morus notabilis]|uniref:Uncharacterized protein n=1 Tax=Morus notabilis TaxID=981085 RepID=W9QYC6_9ROSA|nr:hypothetical protein L484_020189 [Morus notabilis]
MVVCNNGGSRSPTTADLGKDPSMAFSGHKNCESRSPTVTWLLAMATAGEGEERGGGEAQQRERLEKAEKREIVNDRLLY